MVICWMKPHSVDSYNHEVYLLWNHGLKKESAQSILVTEHDL